MLFTAENHSIGKRVNVRLHFESRDVAEPPDRIDQDSRSYDFIAESTKYVSWISGATAVACYQCMIM